jgi:hypothetical protein
VGDRFVIVHGERRFRAVQSLGWVTIPAEVRDLTPEDALWLALAENVQRQDLTPTEEARTFQAILATGITQAELGRRLGKSQSYIAQKLRLLTLPDPLQFYLDRGAISEGHARQLLKLKAIYGDLGADCSEWQPELDNRLPEWEAWAILAGPTLRDIRPEDNPVAWPGFFGGGWAAEENRERAQTLAEGCRLLFRYGRERGVIGRWEVVAFWWASLVYQVGLSVADLAKALDGWEERFWTALYETRAAYETGGGKMPTYRGKTPRDRDREALQWAYHSDLRHAGASEWAKIPLEELSPNIAKGLLGAMKGMLISAPLYPSSFQPWGFNHQVAERLSQETG